MATRQPDKNYYDLYRIQKDKRRREMQEIDRLDRKLGKLIEDRAAQAKLEHELLTARLLNENSRHGQLSQQADTRSAQLERAEQDNTQLKAALEELLKECNTREEFNKTTVEYNAQCLSEQAYQLELVRVSMAEELHRREKELKREAKRAGRLKEKEQALTKQLWVLSEECELHRQKYNAIPNRQDLEQTRRSPS